MAQSGIDCPVNGGDGQYSYSQNSNFQRKAIDGAKELIKKGIAEKLDPDFVSLSNTFRVADLGCAAGPNTFSAVQNIVDSVIELDSKNRGNKSAGQQPDILVFFNDQTSNDFNHLFASLQKEKRPYFAAGVPGSFHGRLFPRDSLHFVHSSYSVQILSRVPEEVLDKTSPAWNKGRVHYSGAPVEVVKAYQARYAEDMEIFLRARAEEIVRGGLMAFVVPGRPNGTDHSESLQCRVSEILGACLVDLANKGKISPEKVDSLNMPMYFASLEEVERAVKVNGRFSIEMMENIAQEKPKPEAMVATMRAGMGAFLAAHFGHGIIPEDELFHSLFLNFQRSSSLFESANSVSLFVLLKRI